MFKSIAKLPIETFSIELPLIVRLQGAVNHITMDSKGVINSRVRVIKNQENSKEWQNCCVEQI